MIKTLLLSISFFIITFTSFGQVTKTFNSNGAFTVPAGVTSVTVNAWGGGGSGGGSTSAGSNVARGGAGGGGGAYATAPITVSSGTVLTVDVAAATAGTSGGNGSTGDFSTISGYESTIYAAGGKGGARNNAGGSPAGGAGGAVVDSKGTPIAGAAGGTGNTGLGISSGAGGKGANSGGNGGAALTGQGTSENGNQGSQPGGGGGGARTSENDGNQTGGIGAAGRVNIVYNCVAYSLSSITAVKCSSSTVSTITLNSTTAGLPIGTYTVTYNTTNTNYTGRTATMVVTTAGKGSFATTDLTTSGSSTITITNLSSGSASNTTPVTTTLCSTNVNTTATLSTGAAVQGGYVAYASPACYNTSITMTLAGTVVGSIIQWEKRLSPSTTWVTIPNTTASTYTETPPSAGTWEYRVLVGDVNCSTVYSTSGSITINPEVTITLDSANAPVCRNTTAVLLPYSQTTGNANGYALDFNSAALSAGFNNAGGNLDPSPGAITIQVPYSVNPGTYNATLRVFNYSPSCSSVNYPITVTVSSQITTVSIAPTGTQNICVTAVPANPATGTTLNVTETGGTITSRQWGKRSVSGGTITAIASATGTSYTPTGASLTAGTWYVVCTSSNGGCSVTSNEVIINVGNIAGSPSSTPTVCTAATMTPVTHTTISAAGIGSPTNLPPGLTASWASNTITISGIPTTAGTYNYSIPLTGGCGTGVNATGTITVNGRPTSVLSGTNVTCNGTAKTLSVALTGTGPWNLTYSDGTTSTNATANSSPFTFNVTPSSTKTYTVTALNDAKCTAIAADRTGNAVITVNPRPTSIISGTTITCDGTAKTISVALTGTGPWNLTYTDGTTPTSVTANSSPFTFNVTPTSTKTYTVTALNDAKCTAIAADMTGSAVITINPRPTSVISGTTVTCDGTPKTISVALTGTGPWNLTYSDGTTSTNATANSSPFTFNVTPSSTKTYTVTALNDAKCTAIAADMTGSAVITINPRPTSVISGTTVTCDGTPKTISVALTGTGPWNLTYSDGTTSTNATANSSPFTFNVTPSSTKTYTVTALNDAKCTAIAADMTGSAVITVNTRPTSAISGTTVTCDGTAKTISVALTGTGPWNLTYTDGTIPTSVTANSSPFTFNVTPSSTKTYTVTALNDAKCTAIAADMTGNAIITVNPRPTSVISGTSVTCDGTTKTISVALTGTAPWNLTYTDGTTPTSVTANSSPFTFNVTPSSTKTYTVTALNDAKCTAIAADRTGSAVITVNTRPTSAISGTTVTCDGTAKTISVALTGTGPWNLTYTDGTTPTSVTANSSPFTFNVTPSSTKTYTVTALNDAKCTAIAADMTGNAIITVNPRPTSVISGTSVTCDGTTKTISVALTGTAPWNLTYTDGTTPTSVTANSSPFTFNVTPSSTKTYTVTALNDAKCTAIAADMTGSAIITVNPRPTSVISGTSVTCNGTTKTISVALTGTAPWNLTYTDGTTPTSVTANSSPFTFNVTPSSTKTYTVTALNDAKCTAIAADMTGSAIITVNPRPTSVISGATITCDGTAKTISVALTGTAPWNLTYTDGTIPTSVTANSSPFTFNVTPSSTKTYTVTALNDAKCTAIAADMAGSAIITVNPRPTTPTASVTTQPTCVIPTGIITITNPAPASGISYSIDGTDYSNTSGIFTGVAVNSYNVSVQNSSGCISLPTSVTVNPPASKTWTGAADSNWNVAGNWTPSGVPTATDCVIIPDLTLILNKPAIKGTNGNFSAFTLTIRDQASLTVEATNTITVEDAVTVLGTGDLTFENQSSLLQTNTGTNINTGNINYKRDTAPVRRYDVTYWSSPVTSATYTLHDLSPSTLGDKYYTYDPTNGFIINYNGTSTMNPGVGYLVRAPQPYDIDTPAIYTAKFVGVPNNGDISVTPQDGKWNLIGNPYPSAIDADELIGNNSTGALYFWTHNTKPSDALPGDGKYNYTSADYAVYSLTGSISTSGATSVTGYKTAPLGKIAAGQSFFMKASSANPIVFINHMRLPGENSQFFKTTKSSGLEKNRLWINLANAQGVFKQTLVGYIEGATNSWDLNYDAATINGNEYADFYTINDTKKLSVQGRALPFANTDLVPLGYRTTVAGDFTISIDHADGLFINQKVYLEDKTTGTVHDLTAGDYTFTTATGTFTDRFTLKYSNKTLGTGDFENIDKSVLVSVKDKLIKVNSTQESIKEVTIYDITGKLLYNKKKVENTELQITNLQSSNQVLVIKVTLENDYSTSKKIIFN